MPSTSFWNERVRIFLVDHKGREVTLNVQGPGEYFGELTMDGGPRSASVMTLEAARFMIVARESLHSFFATHPDFATHLVRKLINRVQVLTERVKSLALQGVYGPFRGMLKELAVEQDGVRVVEGRVLIRLAPKPTRCSGSVIFGIKLGIGRRGDVAGDAKQRAEGVAGIETTVEAEREFVEIGLQMLRADAVMDTAHPGLKIGEHEVDDGQAGFGNVHVAPFRNGGMKIPRLPSVA